MKNKKQLIIGIIAALLGLALLWRAELLPQNASQDVATVDVAATVHVARVIDGDTFVLDDGRRVRLLGIDTPEKGKWYFDEATDRMRDLVEGKDVTLVKDLSETDKYGRLLRHAYIGDQWINQIMIAEGYARFITIPPDVMHVETFRVAQQQAFADQVGLWQTKE